MSRKILRPKFILLITLVVAACYLVLSHSPHASPASQARLDSLLFKQNNCVAQALFTPQDNIAQTLIDLIENEKKSIKLAVYFITHHEIAMALAKAKLVNHVDIQIITDSSHLENSSNCQAWYLQENGVDLFIFDPTGNYTDTQTKTNPDNLTNINTNLANNLIEPISDHPGLTQPDLTNKRSLMHNKFFIFEQNLHDQTLLVTGSFNCTYSAQKYNQENIVILDLPQLIQKYRNQFNWLKSHAKPLELYTQENLIGKTQAFGNFAR
jgi:phosphatidylserine/phosphatidylglycerophosphate/cardiolipin synthase-like enzyme